MGVDLPGYEGEHHVATEADLLHRGGHDRSCRGHRSDEVEVRPWYRKDRQGNARAVGHTHQAACDHEAANVHILLHVYHRTPAVECVGGNRHGEDCSPEEDRDDRSSRRMAQVGNRHRHRHRDGPRGSETCICHGLYHLDHRGLRREREA